ncbi:MAG: CPBP family intramembrane metalloprotease [Lachnospiraceae bacterium]|nr:CPBP family intramembrane metalloprotease [Lachnospiraceae bacterium]
MKQSVKNANLFLLIYVICYLLIGFKGTMILSVEAAKVVLQFYPLVLAGFYFILTKQNPIRALAIKPFHIVSIPFVILYTYLVLPFTSVINAVSQLFVKSYVTAFVNQSLASKGLFLSVLSMALAPAFMEEFVFRGVYYQGIKSDPKIKAILLSALCFGLMHMNFNQFFYAFFLGICMALMVEATGSLLASMLVHFTFNTTSVVMAFSLNHGNLAKDAAEQLSEQAQTLSPESVKEIVIGLGPFAVIGLLLAFLVLLLIAKLNKRTGEFKNIFFSSKKESSETGTKGKIGTPTLYLFLIICIYMCIYMYLRK